MELYIRPLPPHEVAEKLIKVTQEVCGGYCINHFGFNGANGHNNFIQGNPPKVEDALNDGRIKEGVELLRTRPYLDPKTISLNTNNGCSFNYRRDDDKPWRIEFTRDNGGPKELLSGIDALSKHFNLLTHQETLRAALTEREAQSFEYVQKTISDFAVQAAKLAQLSAENTTKLSEQIMQQTTALEAKFQEKEKGLETAYAERKAALDKREQELSEKQKIMDTRDNTAVRRELFQKIQDIITEQKHIEISPATLAKRWPIHVICALCLAVSLGLAVGFGIKILSAGSPDWHLFIPLSAGIALFVTTSVFYVKWNDNWFSEHAEAEFRNRKFKADIARASWIAELLFEDKKRETVLPLELITSYANNLFRDDGRASTRHPYDELADVLKNVSSMKVSKAGVELTKQVTAEKS